VVSLISEKIGVNEAARVTCIKPAGTTSLALGVASGIHAWHAPFYLRTMRFNKNEAVAQYLMIIILNYVKMIYYVHRYNLCTYSS
jgi:hypothetical protein